MVHAEAQGSGYEAHLLAPLIETTRQSFAELDLAKDVFAQAKVTAERASRASERLSDNVTLSARISNEPDSQSKLSQEWKAGLAVVRRTSFSTALLARLNRNGRTRLVLPRRQGGS